MMHGQTQIKLIFRFELCIFFGKRARCNPNQTHLPNSYMSSAFCCQSCLLTS